MSGETVIEARSISRSFEELSVLSDLDFRLTRGEFVAIMGRSGVGKSTLLGILGIHDLDYEGSLTIAGTSIESARPEELARLRREVTGFVFQDFHLLPHLSPLENVVLPAVFCGRDYEKSSSDARALLSRLDIRIQDRPSSLLSRGERQRVAVARGLLSRPTVLLADEPSASLDEETEGVLFDLIGDLRAEVGFALVAVVHTRRILERADRALELRDGSLVEA